MAWLSNPVSSLHLPFKFSVAFDSPQVFYFLFWSILPHCLCWLLSFPTPPTFSLPDPHEFNSRWMLWNSRSLSSFNLLPQLQTQRKNCLHSLSQFALPALSLLTECCHLHLCLNCTPGSWDQLLSLPSHLQSAPKSSGSCIRTILGTWPSSLSPSATHLFAGSLKSF